MGQPANLIIVEHREYTLYYSHWCANTLTRDLFWGPEHAISFVSAQRAVDETGWLDDVWAEGGAVVDCDHQVLLLFGGEDILYDVPLRRVYLAMLRQVYRGWEVRWAHEGIAEIADYVGYPRDLVLSAKPDNSTSDTSLSPPEQLEWTGLVGSFRTVDGQLELFPLHSGVEHYLLAGPTLLDKRERAKPVDRVPLDQWLGYEFPTGGFHVDVPAKRVEYWAANDLPDTAWRVSQRWPSWKVTWHRDAFEWQLKATSGKLQFPMRSTEILQQQVKEMLLRDDGRSPVETILEITDKARQEGKDVQINPWALRDDRRELDAAERQRIVALALETSIES